MQTKLLLNSCLKELDYILIRIDESEVQSIGVKPILADSSQLPIVKQDDSVYMIQHPRRRMKDFCQSTVRRVNRPFIQYYGDTMEGPSGSPVFVLKESKFLLVALHISYPRIKGVLVSEILGDLDIRNGKIYCFLFFTVSYIILMHIKKYTVEPR